MNGLSRSAPLARSRISRGTVGLAMVVLLAGFPLLLEAAQGIIQSGTRLSTSPRESVSIRDLRLVAFGTTVEAEGNVTGLDSGVAGRLELRTYFTDSRGRSLGTATGTVSGVRPGNTRSFTTRGVLPVSLDAVPSLRWKTRLIGPVGETARFVP